MFTQWTLALMYMFMYMYLVISKVIDNVKPASHVEIISKPIAYRFCQSKTVEQRKSSKTGC